MIWAKAVKETATLKQAMVHAKVLCDHTGDDIKAMYLALETAVASYKKVCGQLSHQVDDKDEKAWTAAIAAARVLHCEYLLISCFQSTKVVASEKRKMILKIQAKVKPVKDGWGLVNKQLRAKADQVIENCE